MANLKSKKSEWKFIWRSIFTIFFILSIFFVAGKAKAANLFFSPAVGNFYVGDTFTVGVYVDTQDIAINSVDTVINFPEDKLQVVSLGQAKSIFSLWVQQPAASATDGNVSFTGGLPTPGFTGASGIIMDVTFKAIKSGVAKINYSGSAVRANDGLGTNVFQNSGEGEYTITAKPISPEVEAPAQKENVSIESLSPTITSLTHPDSEKWYSDNNPKFAWTFPDDFNAIRISYDENPTATPNLFYASKISEQNYTNLRDGIYYLHVQVRDGITWSKISNYKFQIDTERPLNFDITELDKGNTIKTSAEFTFNASDTLSGLDHFEISIDNSAPTIITDITNQDYKTGTMTPGNHVIFIKVFDKAGNYITGSALFSITPSLVPAGAQTIISEIVNYLNQLYLIVLSAAKVAADYISNAINTPLGSAILKTLSALGLIAMLIIPFLMFIFTTSPFDMWLMLASFLAGILGLRRKYRAWGTVYDSITKRPLELVRVYLIDLETGRHVESYITDSDGRYRFNTLPGRYGIETKKTNYISPSMIMKNQVSDEVHNNLYFGEEIVINNESDAVARNIPMDSLVFDWNKFIKEKMNGGMFMEEKAIRGISRTVFEFGAVAAILSAIFMPVNYNLIVLLIYSVVSIASLIFRGQEFGTLIEGHTNIPLSFAVVKIFKAGDSMPFVKKVADKFGNYFAQVPNGKYYLVIDKKNNDGSYLEVLHTADIDVRNGTINFHVRI